MTNPIGWCDTTWNPMTTDPRERLKQKLVDGGYGGLYCPDEPCGCELDDLAPCGQDIEGDEGIDGYCQPGYKFDCIDKKCANPCDGQMAGSWCITRSPDGPKEVAEPEPTTDYPALEEYRRKCLGCSPVTYLPHVLTLANAALAEQVQRAERAESFVAQLKYNIAHEDEKKRERESRKCESCHYEQEGLPETCAANVAVFLNETDDEHDHPPLDFSCSRWQPREPHE